MNQNHPGKNMPIQLKTALKILISTVLLFIYYYIVLPPLNPFSVGFWFFLMIALIVYLVKAKGYYRDVSGGIRLCLGR